MKQAVLKMGKEMCKEIIKPQVFGFFFYGKCLKAVRYTLQTFLYFKGYRCNINPGIKGSFLNIVL